MSILNRFLGKSPALPHRSAPSHTPPQQRVTFPEPREISSTELQEWMRSDNPPLLIDVRESSELQRTGAISGAVHMPMSTFPGREDELPRDRPLVIVCAAGIRSHSVGCYLMDSGFEEVLNLTGGINSWVGGRDHI
ncbi:hypothetical protein JXA47_13400 [Candidatus Sumerlaeota bacterium]|nr:hypothetical protein [Candidatus Sumerlaeota bacterium]